MKPYPKYENSGVEWIGDIPSEWKVIRFKYALSLITNKANDNNLMKIALENITSWTGSLVESGSQFEGDGILFENNDILFGKLRPYLAKIWKANFSGSAVGDIFVFRPKDFIFPNFAFYRMISAQYINVINGSTFGAKMPRASWNFIGNLPFLIPPLSEQNQIAKYLDQKTAKIDSLIEKKKRLIELLKEERAAVINQAVIKGLDPNVPMKASGIEWLGEVPEHWEVVPLTKYLASIVDYRGRTPKKVSDGIFLVTAKNIKNGIIDYTLSEEFVDPVDVQSLLNRGRPKVGDVLFTTEAPLGEVANIDREDIALAQRVIKFRGKQNRLNNFFLKFLMLSSIFQQDLQSFATGSTALGIKASKLNYLRLVLPPIDDQLSVVKYIEKETSRIDSIISKSEKEIELLQEYRTALISEVVTGKIDIREEKV